MSRRLQLAKAGPAYDPTTPPKGTRLWLGVVASRLGVTITQMASTAEISRTAIADVLTNVWPVRRPREEICTALRELMAERGATDDELAQLFHAHGRPCTQAQSGPDARFQPPPPPAAAPPVPPVQPEEEMLLPKQTLTPQAKRHFKMFVNPFDGEVTTDDQMFVGNDIAYCREAVSQCVQTAGFVALIGESGAGKTTLLQDLEYRLEHDSRSVTVIKPGVLGMEGNDTKGKAIKSADILHAIITALQPDAVVPQTLQARTVRAGKLLTESARSGNEHLLVVEEAHCMPDATLKHLKRLHELRLGRKPLLGILLLAQPELKKRLTDGLRDGSLREVAQRCEIVELLPLDGDLRAYLQRRADAAGVPLKQVVDEGAIEQLRARLTFKRGNQAISMCYPLAVNNLLTRAINAAADLGAPVVTKDVIQAI